MSRKFEKSEKQSTDVEPITGSSIYKEYLQKENQIFWVREPNLFAACDDYKQLLQSLLAAPDTLG